ncbi:MAG: ribosome biogenesis GTPase Der [Acidobacteriota bacterium]|nr:ribosome biogenesis GTPase Der [Acidobacteriota bacterium]
MVGRRRAIVGDEPGITRDRLYGTVRWNGRQFRVVDTGGIIPEDKDLIPSEIFRQARVALDEADAIVMVTDVRTELTGPDMELARLLQKLGKPLYLAVNKVDDPKLEPEAENFRRLGIKNLFSISAEHSTGVAELIEELQTVVPTIAETEDERRLNNFARRTLPRVELDDETGELYEAESSEEDELSEVDEAGEHAADEDGLDDHLMDTIPSEIKIAIIGRPNVGKSTLLNNLTGSDRAIVSSIAGTTRDAIDEVVEHDGRRYRFIDTAGIRRKGKTHLMAEKMSVVMARRHLEEADVALMVIDALEGVSAIDANIAGYAHESGRSVVVVVNKWDLVTTARPDGKPAADSRVYEEQLRRVMKFLDYAPVIFVSAMNGKNVKRVFETVERVARERWHRVSTGEMNRFLKAVDFERATVPMRNRVKIYYVTQAAVAPPTFMLFTDKDVKLHFSYQRFLENQIREAFGFEGTPIWIKNRPRKRREFIPKAKPDKK